jgi:hypothetical protein
MTIKNVLTSVIILINFTQSICQKYFYISDAGNFQQGPYQILRYNVDGSDGKVFIKNNLAWPQDILFTEDGNHVLISNLSTNSVEMYDSETGAYIKRMISGINGPTRMRIGKDGMLYVLQWQGDGKVRKYDASGNFISNATQTGVPTSIGMDWDQEGLLYVSSYNGKFVERFDKDGVSKGKFISSGLSGPTNIEFTSDGNLIVLDYNSGRVLLYDKDGKLIKILFQGVQNCEGIYIGKDGEIIVGAGTSVSVYNKNNQFQKYLVPPGENGLRNANAVVFREINTSGSNDVSSKKQEVFLKKTNDNMYIVSPNPDRVKIVDIFDYSGKKIKTFDPESERYIDLGNIKNGMYFAQIILKNHQSVTQNLIVLE